MTGHEHHSDDAKAAALANVLRNGAEVSAVDDWQETGLERLSRSVIVVKRIAPRRRRWPAFVLAAASFVLVIGGAFWMDLGDRAKKVTFEVQGADLNNPNYVIAPENGTAHLKFSDGSTVDLERSARLRVQQATPHGATLLLERGTAVTHVVHRSNSSWKLFAGSFEIAVIGTRFQAGWDPATETLQVDLYEGTLQIGGQRTGEMAVLKSGQRFHAVGYRANWSISPIDGPSDAGGDVLPMPSVAASLNAPVQQSESPVGKVSSAQPAPARVARDWASAVAKGDFSRIVAEAESRGIANCLDQCSIAEVRYLADAARYTRRFELAEQSLMAMRRRAASEAPAAAYLLGALSESQGRTTAALRWYEQSVAEAPLGRYVSEARAGCLRMLVATQQHEAARAAATRYLNDFPHGVGVTTAKKILSEP